MPFFTLLFVGIGSAFASVNYYPTQEEPNFSEPLVSTTIGDTVAALGEDICYIVQDQQHNYWFASNGDGVYYFNGKCLIHITEKDGLCSNFVLKIDVDTNGFLWFSGRGGLCFFDGFSFFNYTDALYNAPTGQLPPDPSGLFFGTKKGLCYYDGKGFSSFSIYPQTYVPDSSSANRPYSVYSSLIDKNGHVWFGTQERGVCRYDGDSFTYYTAHGLDRAAVRCLFQDTEGTIWAGNNGAGLFRFNGSEFINFTEERGLANPDFLNKQQGKEGSLARPFSINEDKEGNLWIGTIDAGLWKLQGDTLQNYTKANGLSELAIWYIYKDHNGELWFVSQGHTVNKFNGQSFEPYLFPIMKKD